LRVPSHPLDVLCQQLLGMAAQHPWSADEALTLVRRAYPYRDLSRGDFDGCLDYLSGRHREKHTWLPARLRWDDDEFTILDARTTRLLRRNIGTILAEEPRQVRLRNEEGGTMNDESRSSFRLIGEVDESFAERLQPGDRFLLAGRCLEFRHSEYSTLLVDEVIGKPAVPRWRGDGLPLAPELARRLYLLRIQAAEALREGPSVLADLLHRDYGLHGQALTELVTYFQRQECASEIPDAATCLVEVVNHERGTEYYVHTPLNRAGNDALARVATLRVARSHGHTVTSLVADLGFALLFSKATDIHADRWREILALDTFEADLCHALAESVTLRERFQCVAMTGLMLLRNPLGRRRRVGGPNWAERRLFEHVRAAAPEFMLLLQALREVREECCDADAARAFLIELPRLVLRCRRLPRVSPFVESWTQLAAGPVESVESPAEALQRLHAALTGSADIAGAHAR